MERGIRIDFYKNGIMRRTWFKPGFFSWSDQKGGIIDGYKINA